MFQDAFDGLASWAKNLGPVKSAVIVGSIIGVLSIASVMTSSITHPDLALLYSDLEAKDAGKIVAKLEAQGVVHEIREGGRQIFVPKQDVGRLRVMIAEEGLPAGGNIGYEIFDKMDSFGTTSFVQDVNLIRALEGELSRTIRSIQNIEAAKVHLVMQKRQLFSRDAQQPSASIMLKTAGKTRIGKQQVAAIQHLVAAAVPGLLPQNISIVDDKGTLLARGSSDEADSFSIDEARFAYELRMSRMIESLLERSVGVGKVRAEVTVEMDYDKKTENSEVFNPDGQVVRSTQNIEDGQNSQDNKPANTTVSVQENTPGEGTQQGQRHQANKTEETVNYEISKTVTVHVKEGGQIRRLSVAVLVDGMYKAEGGEKPQYVARSKEELETLARLVRSAVGFKSERGDHVEVLNMPFVEVEDMASSYVQKWFGFDQQDLMRLIKIFALTILGLAIIFFVIKPMMRIKLQQVSGQISDASSVNQMRAVQAPAAGALPSNPAPQGFQNPVQSEVAQMAGTAKATVQENPELAAEIVRTWMKEG